MKKILLVGSGAREHAIAKALKRSKHQIQLFTFGSAKNPGIFELSEEYYVGKLSDLESIQEFAKTNEVDFAVIGPDNPIADGATDALKEIGIPSFAPSKKCAQLESSKGFTRNLLEKYNIPGNPNFKAFEGNPEENKKSIQEFIKELGNDFVVKYDALLGGKGVKVSGEHLHSQEEGVNYALECLAECGKVVIEEKFIGEEFSLIALVDGNTVLEFPSVQDHKRAYVGDTGPNTGGMGTYTDANHLLPFITEEDVLEAHEITVAVMEAMEEELGEKYKGVMYGGFIATKDGVRLIEYNARFGDPEAMNLLSILKSDFVDICEAVINETLGEQELDCENLATVCKYVVPEGYPDAPIKGEKITLGKVPANCEVYYAAIDQQGDDLIMTGSRAIAFVGKGKTLEEAESAAETGAKSVQGKVFHREDIGTTKLIQKRIDHMKQIRG